MVTLCLNNNKNIQIKLNNDKINTKKHVRAIHLSDSRVWGRVEPVDCWSSLLTSLTLGSVLVKGLENDRAGHLASSAAHTNVSTYPPTQIPHTCSLYIQNFKIQIKIAYNFTI